jgi:hypothetical protein
MFQSILKSLHNHLLSPNQNQSPPLNDTWNVKKIPETTAGDMKTTESMELSSSSSLNVSNENVSFTESQVQKDLFAFSHARIGLETVCDDI